VLQRRSRGAPPRKERKGDIAFYDFEKNFLDISGKRRRRGRPSKGKKNAPVFRRRKSHEVYPSFQEEKTKGGRGGRRIGKGKGNRALREGKEKNPRSSCLRKKRTNQSSCRGAQREKKGSQNLVRGRRGAKRETAKKGGKGCNGPWKLKNERFSSRLEKRHR